MTANEMKYRFNILYNKITKFDAPGYKDRELSELFTLSQNEGVKQAYNPKGNKYDKGFENSEKRRKDLDFLLRNVYLTHINYSTDQTLVHKKGIIFTLPADMLWAVQEECSVNIYEEGCITYPIVYEPKRPTIPELSVIPWDDLKVINVKPITHDEYNLNRTNPFKKPYEELIWRLDAGVEVNTTSQIKHELINFTDMIILRYRIVYLRIPQKIVVDTANPLNQVNCELIETMHDEIIVRAVEMATGITAPEEYKIKSIETAKSE